MNSLVHKLIKMLWKNARKAKTHVSGFKGGKTWYGSGVKGWERRNHATKGAKNMAGDKWLCLVSWINVFYLTYFKVFIILYIVRSFSKLVLLFKNKSWVDENSLDHGCCPLNVTQHHWIISNSAPHSLSPLNGGSVYHWNFTTELYIADNTLSHPL